MDGVDDSYIWQRRIAHGVRYQKGAVPFPESVEIGLEFNAALERKEKLDLSLLTNGVILEICEFAKTVTKSEKYFLFEMLDFNFDLGLDLSNYSLCYAFTFRVHSKIKHLKDQIKLKPSRGKETFRLPDVSVLLGSKQEEVSGGYCPKWNRIADSSVLTDASKNSQSSDCSKAETNGVASNTYTIKKQGGILLKQTKDTYPLCAQLGVDLALRSNPTLKQKLDPNLITNGVMMELLNFSGVLCGRYTYIIYDLVKLNFGYALNRLQLRLYLNRLMEKKYACLTAEDREAFRKEVFKAPAEKKWEYSSKKRKRPPADDRELERQTMASSKRETRRQSANNAKEKQQEGELSFMCPVDSEMEMQSGATADPEKVKPESCSSGTEAEMNLLQDVKQEEEEVFISSKDPPDNGCESCFSNARANKASPRPHWELFSEERCAETEKQRLWLRRAARAKQILMSNRVNDMFVHCREIGLDFNVSSSFKQSLDLQLFTNWVMWEIFKFATAMSRSVRSFLFEILFNNFTLTLHDEVHERNFIFYLMSKSKTLANHPKSEDMEFLSKPFKFPEIYNMVDMTSNFQPKQEVHKEEWEDSTNSMNQESDMEDYPFCKKMGLNLWSTEERPTNQKLDLSILTTGALLEIFSFVRELCGSARDTVNDILEHNFNIDLQNGETMAAQVIQKWYTTQKNLMKKQNISPKINRWLNTRILLNGQQILQPPTEIRVLELDTEKPGRDVEALSGYVKEINYQNCKEVGLDLDIRSKSETKTKLDLQVLTRRVLLEVHQYVEQNCNRYVPALYEILEYNFDLSSQNHRKVEFAWSIASQVIAMTGKKCRKGDYLNKVFELPFEDSESLKVIFKEEPEDDLHEPVLNIDDDDIVFVRKLKPVDIEVEID